MNDRQQSQSFSSLPRPQKTAVILLSIIAIGVFVIWIWQFNTRINKPFKLSPEEIALGEEALKRKTEQEIINKTKDTDGDGISDYDETNIYGTSPYLEDTDGDGISDFDEVRVGKNPLCAEGTDCGLISSSTEESNQVNQESQEIPAQKVEETLLIKALSGEGDAETMRQILLQAGADKDQVSLLSDEDLMEMYIEILSVQNPGINISTTTSNQ